MKSQSYKMNTKSSGIKRLSVWGSTGSIGVQTLDVVRSNPDRFRVVALTAHSRKDDLLEQIIEFRPEVAVIERKEAADYLRREISRMNASGVRGGLQGKITTEILTGQEGLVQIATADYDLAVNALLGISGLVPTWYAVNTGHDIALANKETLVTGGQLIMKALAQKGVRIFPIDSEHSAIFQSLEAERLKRDILFGSSTGIDFMLSENYIDKILLTASGGPFRGYSLKQLEQVRLEQALRHPNWSMGSKITIDSATMMNKGFEVMEARWLFGVNARDVQVLVHPQSLVHSMVQFKDHSVIAQLGNPDMRLPIGYALNWPDRLPNDYEALDFFDAASNLTFERPDMETFDCLKMAYEVSEAGGTYPVALNGANEVLVQKFLNREIEFIDIQRTLRRVLEVHSSIAEPELEDILAADLEAREKAEELA